MPIYEYRCEECGCVFEELQKITDPPVEVCPECKGRVKRLFSTGTGLVFKGCGFYITDYKNKGNGGERKSGGSDGKGD